MRLTPPASSTGSVPFQLISKQAAALVLLRTDDGAAAQEIADIHGAADEAWCTSCCTDDQYMYLKLVRQMICASFICAARKPTSSCMIVIVRLRLPQIGQRLPDPAPGRAHGTAPAPRASRPTG